MRDNGVGGMLGARRFILGAVALLGLAGCSGAGDERTILTVATVNNGDMIRLKEFTADFEKAHPDIRIKWVVLEENVLRQRVTTDVAIRGGQYDIITIGAYEVPVWAGRKWLTDLSNLGPAYRAQDLIEPVRDLVSYGGAQYAAPFNGESSITMYRTDLFRQVGLTMPERPSWEFLIDAAAKIHDPQKGRYGVCLRGMAGWGANVPLITAMANAYGGRLFDEKWRPQFDTPEWRKAFNVYVGALRNYGPPGASSNSFNENLALFAQGKCGIWVDATVAAPFLSDPKTSTVANETGFALAPDQGLGRSTSWLWTWALAIPSSSKKIDAAKKFVTWAAGPAYQEVVAKRLGWLAVPPGTRKSLYANPDYRKAAPFADITLQAISESNPQSPTIKPVPYVGIQYAAIPEFQGIGTEVGQQFAAAVAGRVSPDNALAEAQAATRRQMAAAGYYE